MVAEKTWKKVKKTVDLNQTIWYITNATKKKASWKQENDLWKLSKKVKLSSFVIKIQINRFK